MADIIWLLLAVSLALPIPMPTIRQSRMVGSMTWYDIPGGTMRNGQPFDGDAMCCAVDDSWWDREADRPLFNEIQVCVNSDQDNSRKCEYVIICDTGWLARYGVLIDCTPAVWRALGVPLAVGRQAVTVRAKEEP